MATGVEPKVRPVVEVQQGLQGFHWILKIEVLGIPREQLPRPSTVIAYSRPYATADQARDAFREFTYSNREELGASHRLNLLIEPTQEIVEFDGVQCRLWEGRTPKGVPCFVLVHRVLFRDQDDDSEVKELLRETGRPKTMVVGIPSLLSGERNPAGRV